MERKPRLEGKVAIVTGAGSQLDDGIGNGRAAAVLMAREGARVLLADRKLDAAEATLAMITAEGGEAMAFAADVTRQDDCRAMVEAAVARWGRLDILDNNVGIGGAGTVETVDEETWDRVMAVNVKGMVLASKYAVPAMRQSGGGSIVNISSVAYARPHALTPYAASKGAVVSLTWAMAGDHARD
ncbi:MAG: SDR family NAD(P)-dependent oxidoreductase, partial [Dehalococcoidia bacterium]